jgi:K+-transporting ATPase KdpF subunit
MSAGIVAAPLAALTGADVFGLVVSFAVCVFLLYALLRGERF